MNAGSRASDKELPSGDDGWTLEITPHRPLFDLRLSELGRYGDLILLLLHRELVSTYKQTILGPLWIILQPLMTTAIFTVIFGNVAGLSTDGIPAPVFYLAGVTCWGYFADCFSRSAMVFASNASLFSKVYFPRLVVPLSIALSNLVRFGVQFLVLGVMLFAYRHDARLDPSPVALLLVPVLLALLAIISLGLGLLFSAVTRTYRDLRLLLQFGVQLLMYVTPVIYPLSAMPEPYRALLAWNPVAPVIETFRYTMSGVGGIDVIGLIWSGTFGLSVLFAGVIAFNRAEADFLDTV